MHIKKQNKQTTKNHERKENFKYKLYRKEQKKNILPLVALQEV